jgi:low affinity Fe/Cu permease
VSEGRGAKPIHLKLDELIRGVKGARTGLMGLEQLSDDEMAKLQEQAR